MENRSRKGLGRHERMRWTVDELYDLIPDEEAAVRWFEMGRWAGTPQCGHCNSHNVYETKSDKPQKYFWRDCRTTQRLACERTRPARGVNKPSHSPAYVVTSLENQCRDPGLYS